VSILQGFNNVDVQFPSRRRLCTAAEVLELLVTVLNTGHEAFAEDLVWIGGRDPATAPHPKPSPRRRRWNRSARRATTPRTSE
jgi:hypothetical protein